MAKKTSKTSHYDYLALCLQGGGAMGAYQVGVLQALQEGGYSPDWYAGTSIGAINAAIAAGNPEEKRIEKLNEFWDSIATPTCFDESLLPQDMMSRRLYHYLSAQSTLFFGQPNFFTPIYFMNHLLSWQNSALSYYDTSALYSTLERLVDFDRINDGKTRLSVGAVEVTSGKMTYFDSEKEKIGPEHVMASGALPPGFPPIEVNGKQYWDGGLSSNSPIDYVLSDRRHQSLLCFMVHLFDSYGLEPTNIDDVGKRKKDIEYSSRFKKIVELEHETHQLRYKINQLVQEIPEEKRKSKLVQSCLNNGWNKTVCIVRFLYEGEDDDLSSKDFEFSSLSIHEHIQMGYANGKKGVKKSPWLQAVPFDKGISVIDMSEKNRIYERPLGEKKKF